MANYYSEADSTAPAQRVPTAVASLLLLASALVAIFLLPLIDREILGNTDAPSAFTYVGTGLALAGLTGGFFKWALGSRVSQIKAFVSFALAYNVLIVFVKFTLAPWLLYIYNASQPFMIEEESGKTAVTLVGPALITFMLYFSILYIVYRHFRWPAPDRKARGLLRAVLRILLILGLIAAILFFGFYLLLFLAFSDTEITYYLFGIFGSFGSVVLALALAATLALAIKAFGAAKIHAETFKSYGLVTAAFSAAATLLLAYHGLWIVYVLLLGSYWPLKIETYTRGK